MVGIWFDENQNEHSFRLNNGRFTSIDVPDARRTLVDALLDSGTVSGTYRDKGGVSRGVRHGSVRMRHDDRRRQISWRNRRARH
jgi:hypothetical protein